MAFFNLKSKKKEIKNDAKPVHLVVNAGKKIEKNGSADSIGRLSSVLRKPHISEKAVSAQSQGAYVFDISDSTNKREIKEAISALYKVIPSKVCVVTIPAKRVTVRGKQGKRGGCRKAYVYLKKGDKIETL